MSYFPEDVSPPRLNASRSKYPSPLRRGRVESVVPQHGSTLAAPVFAEQYDAVSDRESDASSGSESSATDDEPQEKRPVENPANNDPVYRAFQTYESKSVALEKKLERFTNSVQTLGSAIQLILSARKLRECLKALRPTVQENSRRRLRKTEPSENDKTDRPLPPSMAVKLQLQAKRGLSFNRQTTAQLRRHCLVAELDMLSNALEEFFRAVGEFPEFTNDDGRRDLLDFIGAVENWSSAVDNNGTEQPGVYRHQIHQLIDNLSHCADTMSDGLEIFIEIGIPCISAAQQRSFQMLLNIATVATFLSAVTASTLQYSAQLQTSRLDISTNTFWFLSLVLSIASAMNSLLTLAWRQAVYSTPKSRVPWWVLVWFRQGCLALLSASIITFLCGLLTYVFRTQHHITIWLVTGFYLFCFIGLGSVTVWFAWERWDFRKMRQSSTTQYYQQLKRQGKSWQDWLYYRIQRLLRRGQTSVPSGNDVENVLAPEKDTIDSHREEEKPEELPVDGAATRAGFWKMTAKRAISARSIENPKPRFDHTLVAVASWTNQMSLLQEQPLLQEEQGTVLHLQFSPSGDWLVSCGREKCHMYAVQNHTLVFRQSLSHKSGHAQQAEWSPDETKLLTRSRHGVKIWSRDSKVEWIIERRIKCRAAPIQALWLNGSEFLALTSQSLYKMRTDGTEVAEYRIIDLQLSVRSSGLVALSFDSVHMSTRRNQAFLIVNQRHSNKDSRMEPWKQLILLDLKSRKATRLILSFDHIVNISISQDNQSLLFAYGSKPPEIWNFDQETKQLTQSSSFSHVQSEYWATSHFFGPGHVFVASCAPRGVTHVWNRHSGDLLRTFITGAESDSASPVVAWGPHSNRPLLVCSGSDQHQSLKLWSAAVTTPLAPVKTNDSAGKAILATLENGTASHDKRMSAGSSGSVARVLRQLSSSIIPSRGAPPVAPDATEPDAYNPKQKAPKSQSRVPGRYRNPLSRLDSLGSLKSAPSIKADGSPTSPTPEETVNEADDKSTVASDKDTIPPKPLELFPEEVEGDRDGLSGEVFLDASLSRSRSQCTLPDISVEAGTPPSRTLELVESPSSVSS